jgi:predicted TIM-barrel enzyme
MSYALEVDMIRAARAKDLLTTPYVFDANQAAAMCEAGADIIVAHMGLTVGGSIGAGTALTLQECPDLIRQWAKAAKEIRNDIIILCHGGPIASPADAEFVLKSTPDCHGFYGASSMERLPTEQALTSRTKEFKAMTL